MKDRRTFLKTTGAAGAAGLIAGCIGSDGGDGDGGDGGGGDGDGDGDGGDEPTETETETEEPYGNGELNFLMSPTEPQEYMESQYQPVKEHLDDQLDVPASLKYARNYSAVLQALGSGTGDVAETGPFAAAIGVRAEKAEVALQRFAFGSWEYTSVIVTKADSGIDDLTDLEGERIAFADRLSASGALFPLFMLKEAGLDVGDLPEEKGSAEFEPSFSGHASAFEALANDQAAAAGVGQFITLNDDRELKEGYEYVETYEGIPRAPIVTSPELSEDEKSAVVDAFTEAPDEMYWGEDGEEGTDDDLWFSDVRPADVDTYQPVIDVAQELNIQTDLLDEG